MQAEQVQIEHQYRSENKDLKFGFEPAEFKDIDTSKKRYVITYNFYTRVKVRFQKRTPSNLQGSNQ